MAVTLAGLPVEVIAAAIQPAAVLQYALNLRGGLWGHMRGSAVEGHGCACNYNPAIWQGYAFWGPKKIPFWSLSS